MAYKPVPEFLNYGVELELTFPVQTDYNRIGLTWTAHTDRSIQCDIGRNCKTIEIVSPVLNGEKGIEQVVKMVNQARQYGATTNTSTGLHVHVSVNKRKYELEDLKRICHNFIKYEKSIDLIMAPSRIENAYCKSNKALFPKDNVEAKELIYNCNSIEALQVYMNRDNRYFKLNLFALNKHGTLEFRQHLGTLNTDQINAWIRFVLWFIANSIMQPRSLALLNDRTCEFGFEAMFKFVIKDEELRKYYLKRKEEIVRSNNGKSNCKC